MSGNGARLMCCASANTQAREKAGRICSGLSHALYASQGCRRHTKSKSLWWDPDSGLGLRNDGAGEIQHRRSFGALAQRVWRRIPKLLLVAINMFNRTAPILNPYILHWRELSMS